MIDSCPAKICGYQVVRVPSENYDEEGRGVWKEPPRIDNVFYGGTDRMPWFELDEERHSEKLTPDVVGAINKIDDDPGDYSGFGLIRDLEQARLLLDFSNSEKNVNELIAVYSKKLEAIKGAYSPAGSTRIRWCGFDIEDLGGNSLILEGIFSNAEVFRDFIGHLNSWGIFDDEGAGNRLIARYIEAADDGLVEELSNLEDELGPSYGIDFVWIGRLEE